MSRALQRADIMMQLVPGAGWSDVARGTDIDALLAEIDRKIGQLDGKIGRLEGRLYAAMAAQTIALAGLFIASRSLA